MIPITLTNSPSLSTVVQTLRDATTRYGPVDVYYDGPVYDNTDDATYTFPGPVIVKRVLAKLGGMTLPLLDGELPWLVEPASPYSFEFVPHDTAPSRPAHVIDAAALWPEWIASLLPYLQAYQLTSVDAILTHLGFRRPIAVPSDGSIVEAFPSKRRRCGIYVLHFADGAYYVGQTTDIIARLSQHRRRYPDIIRLSFRPCPRRDLDFHEGHLIRVLETGGYQLRNVDMTNNPLADRGGFDNVMTLEQQQHWLRDLTFVDDDGPRAALPLEDPSHRKRYRAFQRLPCYEEVRPILTAYLRNGIPAILRGEASYWQASVLPTGDSTIVQININWQEVFTITLDDMGYIVRWYLSERELQRSFGADLAGLHQRYPDLEWERVGHNVGGADLLAVLLWDAASALEFVTDVDVVPAIRHHNLRLVHKGMCPWAKHHNRGLVDDLITPITPSR